MLGYVGDGLGVALLADEDGLALARLDLLEGIEALLVDAVSHDHLGKRIEVY